MTRKGPVCDVRLRKAVIEMNYKGGLEPFASWGPCAAYAPAGVHCWLGFHTCMTLETSARALEVKMCLWAHDLPSQWAGLLSWPCLRGWDVSCAGISLEFALVWLLVCVRKAVWLKRTGFGARQS